MELAVSVYKSETMAERLAAGQLGVAGQLQVQRVVSCWSARSCWSTPGAEGG